MAASNSSSTSSISTTLPSSLAFLVSNFHSLVTIKLESDNYLLWKTQVINALRANGYRGYLEGTVPCPSPTVLDSSNNSVANPDYLQWSLIDNQLLSCLTASLSVATLPHVLGLEHVSQVWYSLEQRFNSLSRSRIHELKNRLYNVKKIGTMEGYIDEIRSCKQRLEAVGHHVDDDDLVFYALNGLPPVFDHIKSGLRLKGDVTFDELTSILTAEESQLQKNEGLSSAKVFVTTQKANETMIQGQQSGQHSFSSHPGSSNAQMFQNPNGSNPYFPQQQFSNFHRNVNSNGGFNRGKGMKGSGFGQNQKSGCQICGKTNHTAFYCYHRQNLEFQPPPFMPPPVGRPMVQPWSGNNFVNQGRTVPSPPQANMLTFNGPPGYSSASGYTGQYGFSSVNSSTAYPQGQNVSGYSPMVNMVSAPSYSTSNMVSPSASNWYFDSGASTHVTHDLANLSQHQSCAPGDGVIVGNGSSIPITNSGQAVSSNTAQGAMPTGIISNHELL